MLPSELILQPGQYEGISAYRLLEAAAHGYVAVDHRFLHAILDHPETSIPDLVRFAIENREGDPVDLQLELIDMFRHLQTLEALPFFISLVRQNPNDVGDQLVEALVELGAPAVDPLLSVLEEIEDHDAGDVPFLLGALRVRDARILAALTRRLETEPLDAALCLEIYGDPVAIPDLESALARIPKEDVRSCEQVRSSIDALSSKPEKVDATDDPFNIWDLYPEEEHPDFAMLGDEQRLAMLRSGSPELRREVAQSFEGSEPSDEVTAHLLELAHSDPDVAVRGACWEALGKVSDVAELRTAMLGVLANPDASLEEKAGAAVALARNYESDRTIVQAIEALYQEPRGRAKGLKAMGYSLDRRFAAYPPKHLDDADAEIKRQAISSVGYLQLSSEAPRLEAFFEDEKYRFDALFAYALSMPGETSPGRARALLAKVEEVAGGFRDDEEEVVMFALDQRLTLRGKRPVFYPEESEMEESLENISPTNPSMANASKIGRNDPCPCNSGKKYKKCCGTP